MNKQSSLDYPAEKQQHSSSFKMVAIAELNIDPEAQRKLSRAWVDKHAPEFDVEQLGYIVVNRRGGAGGTMFVVDGYHRVELMRAVGWGDQRIHAEVFEGMNQAQEARLFIARNDRRSVRRYDIFRIGVTGRDPDALAICKVVQDFGLVISDNSSDGHIVAVDALERLYEGAGIASKREGLTALKHTLNTVTQAWGRQGTALHGTVLLGIGLVQLRYSKEIDQKDLIKKLGPFPGGGSGLLGRARTMKELNGKNIYHCIAALVVDQYNKGRRETRLDPWDGQGSRKRKKVPATDLPTRNSSINI